MTNGKVGLIDNLIGNPKFKGPIRRQATRFLFEYADGFARSEGCEKFLAFVKKPELVEYYKTLGYKEVAVDLIGIAKEI